MVYVASLGVVAKKALGKQVQQSNLNKICELMNQSPDITTMDIVLLGPGDVTSPPMLEKLQNAIAVRHPDICIIYFYTSDAQADLLDVSYKKKCKKLKDVIITEAFEEYVSNHKISQGKQRMSSADFRAPESDSIGKVMTPKKPSLFSRKKHDVALDKPSDNETDDEFEAYEDSELPGDDELEASQLQMPTGDDYIEESFGEDDGLELGLGLDLDLDLDKPEESSDDLGLPPFEPIEPIQQVPLDTAPSFQSPLSNQSLLGAQPAPVSHIEETIANMQSFDDWELFKTMMDRNTIVKRLIEENSEYVGISNMLEVLNKRIETVWRNPTMSAEQKFEKIKDIGLERAVMKASANSIEIEKIINIISAIALSAKAVVDEKMSAVDTAMYKITTDKAMLMDTSELDAMIEKRAQIQTELLNMSHGIVELYQSMDSLVRNTYLDLDKGLPSDSPYINEMTKPIGTAMFTPQNTKDIVNKLMKALQDKRVLMSQLEDSVNTVIDIMFALHAQDEEVIRYQSERIHMLEANRVEDVIIVQTVIKNCMRLYVGADNTGRTATALTWSGALCRRNNVLLIDITGRSKFADYGVKAIKLSEFMLNRIEQQFCCVESDHILAPDELQSMVDEVKTRLNYYAYVNVILAPEDVNGLDQLSVDAKTVSYITDCSSSSIKQMAKVVTQHTYENIARQLITIDAPVSPLTIADQIGIDMQITRMIMLPAISHIRSCAIKHDHPWDFNEVVKLFEEAFR